MVAPKSYWLALVSLPLMVVGALSPWAQARGSTIDGSQDELVLGLAIAAAVLIVLLGATHRRWLAALPLLLGITAAAVTGNDVRDIADFAPAVRGGLVAVDWGIYLALVGSLGLVLGTAVLLADAASSRHCPDIDLARWRTDFALAVRDLSPYLAVERNTRDETTLFFLPIRQKDGIDRFAKSEWKETRHLRRALDVLAKAGRLPARTLFLDVGAHIGTTAILAVRQFGFERALAIEPEQANFRLLQANLDINGLGESITGLNVALSNRVGLGDIVVRAAIGSKHRLLRTGESASSVSPVSLTTLDVLVRSGALDPAQASLLWVDVEGHELEVLQGAQTLLERAVPIVMEFAPRLLGASHRLAELGRVLGDSYTSVVDLRRAEHDGVARPLDALTHLAKDYRQGFTDLLVF